MPCNPAIDLNVDVVTLRHATLKLLKMYLKRRSAAADVSTIPPGISGTMAIALQLDDVFPSPRPSAATVAANRKNPATVCHPLSPSV
jgi:hypothetical protein